jgi:hypothetical protein
MPRRKIPANLALREIKVKLHKSHARMLSLLYRYTGRVGQEFMRDILIKEIDKLYVPFVEAGAPSMAKIAMMSDEDFAAFLDTINEEAPAPVTRRGGRLKRHAEARA